MARAVRCKTEAPRPTNVRAATMYQASNVEHLLRAIMGIRAHPRLTTGKTSLGHYGTQSHGCAGQTVRPSLHSISQTSGGKLSIVMYLGSYFQFGPCCCRDQVKPSPRSHRRSLARWGERRWRRGVAGIPLVDLSE